MAKKKEQSTILQASYLWFLILCYTMVFFASNWFDPRQIKLFGLITGAGSIVFPLTYLFSDIITEVYGYKNARIAVWSSLLFYFIFLFYGQFVVFFLYSHFKEKEIIKVFLYSNNRIILAATLSYFITETINSYLVAKFKILLNGKYMGLRFITATLTAHIFNELVYAPIAFYGLIINTKNLVQHIIGSWAIMVSIELLLLPLSIRLAKHLKTVEGINIYDIKSNFNPFKLDTHYPKKNRESK